MEKILSYLKQLPITAYLVIAGITAGGTWLAVHDAGQRQLGAERILTAQAVAAGDSARADVKRLTADVKRLTVAYTPQAATAAQWLTRWDSTGLRQMARTIDSLKALGVAKPETVPVLVSVGTLAAADSTIKSCTLALQACDQLVGAQRQLTDAERRRANAAEADAKLVRRQLPSKLSPWLRRGEGAAVVLVVLKVAGLLK